MNGHHHSHPETGFLDIFYIVKRYFLSFSLSFVICLVSVGLSFYFRSHETSSKCKVSVKKGMNTNGLADRGVVHSSEALNIFQELIKQQAFYEMLIQRIKTADYSQEMKGQFVTYSAEEFSSFVKLESDYEDDQSLIVKVNSPFSQYMSNSLCEFLIDTAISEVQNRYNQEKKQRLDDIQEFINMEERKIKNIHQEINTILRARAKNGDSTNMIGSKSNPVDLILEYERDLHKTKFKQRELIHLVSLIKKELKITDIPLSKIKWLDLSDAKHKNFNDLISKREELLLKYKPSNPSIKKLDHQISILRERMWSGNKEGGFHYIQVNKLRASMVADLIKHNTDLKGIDNKISRMQQVIDDLNKRSSVGDEDADYKKLKSKEEVSKVLLEDLLKKSQKLKMEIAISKLELKRMYDPVTVDRFLSPILMVIIAIGIAIIVGVIVCLFLNSRERTILDARDVKRHFSMSSLMNIPLMSESDLKLSPDNPFSKLNENFIQLKNKLEYSDAASGSICKLISSVQRGEGKSFVATNLAISYAMDGHNVLLVSCDLNNPNRFADIALSEEQNNTNDLTKYISGEIELEQVYHKSFMENLFYVPTMQASKNSVSLLRSDRFKEFIQMNKKEFDKIILDTAKCSNQLDALICAEVSDEVMLVVQSNSTLIKDVKQSIQRFEQIGANVRGLVLNKTKI